MAAVKPFLPLQYRALSQRDWGRILFVKPLAFVEAVDDMIISLLTFCDEYGCIGKGEQPADISRRERGRDRGGVQETSKELSLGSGQSEADSEKMNNQKFQVASETYSMNTDIKANENDDGEVEGKGGEDREEEERVAVLRNMDRLKLLKSLSLLADSLKWHGSNRHRWGNNLHARRCSNSSETLAVFCSTFIDCYKQFTGKETSETQSVGYSQKDSSPDYSSVAEHSSDNLSTNRNSYSSNLRKLKFEYENTESILSEFFDRPKYYYACNLSVKIIKDYPGCTYVKSQSIPICTALNMISLLIENNCERNPEQERNEKRSRGSWTRLNYLNDLNSLSCIPPSMMMYTNSKNDLEIAGNSIFKRSRNDNYNNSNNDNNDSNISSKGQTGRYLTDQHGLAYKRMKNRAFHRPNVSVRKIKTADGTLCNPEILLNQESSPRSAPRSGKYWWWDVAAVRDWPLLCHLVPQAALVEEDSGFSLLLLTCMKNGAGREVVREFVRYVDFF